MKTILIIFAFLSIALQKIQAQCDSVQVALSFYDGDCGDDKSKIVKYFSPTGKIISYAYYQNDYPNYIWHAVSRDLYSYDTHDSLTSHTYQTGSGTSWIDVRRTLYSFNSNGSQTSHIEQNFTANVWQTTFTDSTVYNNPNTNTIYISNALDTTIIFQIGDSTGAWVNNIKTEKYYNTNHQLIQKIISQWVNNAWIPSSKTDYIYNANYTEQIQYSWLNNTWTPTYRTVDSFTGALTDSTTNYTWINNAWAAYSRTIYSYSGTFADSITTQIMDTVWKNSSLIVNQYSGQNLTQTYELQWNDTDWANIAANFYDYDSLNHVIHTYALSGNDTGWVFTSEIINEVDQYGYPTYQDEMYPYYNNGVVDWASMYGPSYYNYSPTGLLLDWHGHNIPGGPYYGSNMYSGNTILESHSYSETMGGLTCIHDTYYYYADITGDSVFCAGGSTTLYADTCQGYQYQWSNGASTPSIVVNSAGDYFVNVRHPSGISYVSPTITVKVISQLPFLPNGIDSTISICGNSYRSLSSPQQSGITYQWFRNDTALINQINSSIGLYGTNLIDGKYYLCATNSCGSDTSANTFVDILPYPSAPSISPSGSAGICAGDSITITCTQALRYEWAPGGQTTQSITIGSGGNYSVWVYDSAGCNAHSQNLNVSLGQYPSNVIIYLQNGAIQSNYGGTLQWFLNGDTIPGATQTSLTPVLSGYYSLAVTAYQHCTTFTDSIYFNSNSVNVTIQHNKVICPNGSVYLGGYAPVAGGTPPYAYHWTPPNNITSNYGGQIIVSNLTSDQTYYLTVTDSLGNTATDSVHVVLDHPVAPTLIVADSTFCLGSWNPLHVNNNGANYSVQKWIVNGDTIASTNNFYGLYGSGIYQVLISNQNNCPIFSQPDTIIMHARPNAPLINATLDSNACINGSGTLWVNSRPGESYEWYLYPNQILGTDTSLQVSLPVQYEIEITDSNGCQNSSYFNFDLFNENIQMNVVSDRYPLCDSDSTFIHASYFPGWTYEWYDSDNTLLGTGPDLLINLSGYFRCIATSPGGCTATGYISIPQWNSPTVTITNVNGILRASSIQNVTYQWFRNGVEIPGAMNNFLIPQNMGAYYVRVILWNGYGSQCYGYSNTLFIGNCSVNATDTIICSGQCSGELRAIGNGTGNLNYTWSNGISGSINSGLCAGIYIVNMTDSTGCIAQDTALVIDDIINFNLVTTNPNCSGCTNGSIQVDSLNAGSTISWQPNNGNIVGNTIHNLPSAIYTVCITDSIGCQKCIADTLVDTPLNAFNLTNTSLSYYPNPVSDKLYIKGLPGNNSIEVRIYDEIGALVKSMISVSTEYDVSDLTAGSYTIELTTEKKQYRLMFIKN